MIWWIIMIIESNIDNLLLLFRYIIKQLRHFLYNYFYAWYYYLLWCFIELFISNLTINLSYLMINSNFFMIFRFFSISLANSSYVELITTVTFFIKIRNLYIYFSRNTFINNQMYTLLHLNFLRLFWNSNSICI